METSIVWKNLEKKCIFSLLFEKKTHKIKFQIYEIITLYIYFKIIKICIIFLIIQIPPFNDI